MKQILCLSSAPWRKRPTRTQRFLSQFSDAEILYFEPGSLHVKRKDCQRVTPLTYVYTLPYIPKVTEDQAHLSWPSRRKLLRYILSCMNYHRFEHSLLWVCSPLYNELLQDIPYSGLIYDCDQDWSRLPILWESQLTTRADIVFAASVGLEDHLSPCSKNIAVVPNGLDYSLFDPIQTELLPCPDELKTLPYPVFGYTGTIWQNLNLSPVAAAAAAHPEWSFVLIGRVHSGNPYLRRLRRLPNVYFLGPKKTNEIPAYIRHFDVGMSFLRDGMEDDDVLSPRIYEYLSTGMPIVSMYHQLHLEEYPSLIESAYSPQMFVDMCEKVLAHDSYVRKEERQALARKCDWSVRCRQVKEVLDHSKLLGE